MASLRPELLTNGTSVVERGTGYTATHQIRRRQDSVADLTTTQQGTARGGLAAFERHQSSASTGMPNLPETSLQAEHSAWYLKRYGGLLVRNL
jgi:hypothetical protein